MKFKKCFVSENFTCRSAPRSQDLTLPNLNIFGKIAASSVTTALSLKPQGKDLMHQMECLAANTLKCLASGISGGVFASKTSAAAFLLFGKEDWHCRQSVKCEMAPDGVASTKKWQHAPSLLSPPALAFFSFLFTSQQILIECLPKLSEDTHV